MSARHTELFVAVAFTPKLPPEVFEEKPVQWIAEHSEVISALTGLGTLAVWVVYLQVFVSSYRRQLQATLLITRGPGPGLEARCFLSNMSSGPVYVSSVLVRLETSDDAVITPVTDEIEQDDDQPEGIRSRTRQGPLLAGDSRDIGSFGDLIRRGLHGVAGGIAGGEGDVQVSAVLVEVVGLYGPEDLPIGARRDFAITESNGQFRVQGKELQTQQIRKRRHRRSLMADLQRDQ